MVTTHCKGRSGLKRKAQRHSCLIWFSPCNSLSSISSFNVLKMSSFKLCSHIHILVYMMCFPNEALGTSYSRFYFLFLSHHDYSFQLLNSPFCVWIILIIFIYVPSPIQTMCIKFTKVLKSAPGNKCVKLEAAQGVHWTVALKGQLLGS